MKLRNKKTGEIITLIDHTFDKYNSLSEVSEEWEDYEEPKGYYVVTGFGSTIEFVETDLTSRLGYKEMGNYFETREEAEKVVEKLEAWQRLKDNCGISFSGLNMNREGRPVSVNLEFNNEGRTTFDEAVQNVKDLTLLFGGEE